MAEWWQKHRERESHPSVDYDDSSPQVEPYKKPLLKEMWHEVTEWQQKIKAVNDRLYFV